MITVSYISCAKGKPNLVEAELSAAKKIIPPPFSLKKRILELDTYLAEKKISVSPSLSLSSKTKIGLPCLNLSLIRSISNIVNI